MSAGVPMEMSPASRAERLADWASRESRAVLSEGPTFTGGARVKFASLVERLTWVADEARRIQYEIEAEAER